MKISLSWITYNFAKKAFALFLAILIWFAVNNDIQNTISFSEIPVEIKVSSSGYMLINKDQPKVSITLKGTAESIRNLSSQDIRIPFIVSEIHTGLENQRVLQVDQPIDLSSISVPNGLRVIRVTPSRLSVTLDQKVTRKIPVMVVTTGKLPDNIKELEDKREIIPREVKVSGPISLLDNISFIRTQPIHFDSSPINSFSHQYTQIIALSNQVENISVSPKEVSVLLKLTETTKEKSFFDIPVALINYSKDIKLVPKQKIPYLNQVVLYGASEKLKNFDKSKIKAFVDISAIKKETVENVKVCVWVNDPELKVQFVSPASFELDLIDKKELKREVLIEKESNGKNIKRDLLESLENK